MESNELIKQLREQRALTTFEAAEALGFSEGYYKKMEAGRCSITEASALKMSNYFGVEIKPYTSTHVPTPRVKKDVKKIEPKIVKPIPQLTPEEQREEEAKYKILNRRLKATNIALAKEVIRLTTILERILDLSEKVDDVTPELIHLKELGELS